MNAKIFADKVNSVNGANHTRGVTSFGRDSNGRQVVPELYQATSRNSNSKTIATWNVDSALEMKVGQHQTGNE